MQKSQDGENLHAAQGQMANDIRWADSAVFVRRKSIFVLIMAVLLPFVGNWLWWIVWGAIVVVTLAQIVIASMDIRDVKASHPYYTGRGPY